MNQAVRGRGRLGASLSLVLAAVPAAGFAADLSLPALPEPGGVTDVAPVQKAAPGARDGALGCLSAAIYYEAGGEPLEGRQAVAQVVLNRLHHPSYPKSVCGVVYQGAPSRGCQFTFACDGSLTRIPDPRGWRDAEAIAERALDGFVAPSVGASTHYHTLAVHPVWSASLTPTIRIGAHQFYRFPTCARARAYAGGQRFASAAAPSDRSSEVRATPEAASFSVWGLQIARVTPGPGGLAIATPAP